MSNVQELARAQLELENSLKQRMSNFEALLMTSSSSTSSEVNLSKLCTEFSQFKEHTLELFCMLRQQISCLASNMDNLEIRYRRKFLLLHSVEEKPKEEVEKLVVSIVNEHLAITDCNVTSISICHRVGDKSTDRHRPILIKFRELSMRSLVWSKKKQLKGTPYVLSEYLTRHRRDLFLRARKHFGTRDVWTLDGTINVKLSTGTRVKIYTEEDLIKLTAAHARRVADVARDTDGVKMNRAPPAVTQRHASASESDAVPIRSRPIRRK